MRTPTTIIVFAHPARIVPIPPSILRAPTTAQVQIIGADQVPRGRELHPHELVGEVTIEVTTPSAAQYLRRAIGRGDLVVVEPATAPRSAPAPGVEAIRAAAPATTTTAKG